MPHSFRPLSVPALVPALALAVACAPATDASTARGPLGGSLDTDPTRPTDPGDTEPVLPTLEAEPVQVVINELMARNDSSWVAPDGTTPDWVELVNVGDETVALGLLELRDASGNEWTGSGQLAPGQRLLLTSEDLGFGLDGDGDQLQLIAYREVIDEVSWEDLERDVSIARTPDQTGELLRTAWPTPAQINESEVSPTLDAATEHVFRRDMVHRIDFEMTSQAYNTIDSNSEDWGVVGMTFDGFELPQVGLRLKGSASFDRMDGKPAFKVDINRAIPGTRFRTLKGFNLHNGNVMDPTRARDHISYRLAREAGIMAPRVGWADVYVNGIHYGIYMIIEQHDDVMIEANFPGAGETGVMFEPNEQRTGGFGWGNDFGSGNTVSEWDYEEGAIPPDPVLMEALATADELVGQSATDSRLAQLWEVVDQDNVLTYLAWETVTGHTDGYRAPNNWRVFIHPFDVKVHLVPAGAEWTWDNSVDPLQYNGALGDWCLDNNSCKRMYAERVIEVGNLVDEIALADDFMEVSDMLTPYIEADDRSPHSMNKVGNDRQDTFDNIEAFPRDTRVDLCDELNDLEGCTR